jgi:hypothetical protein
VPAIVVVRQKRRGKGEASNKRLGEERAKGTSGGYELDMSWSCEEGGGAECHQLAERVLCMRTKDQLSPEARSGESGDKDKLDVGEELPETCTRLNSGSVGDRYI